MNTNFRYGLRNFQAEGTRRFLYNFRATQQELDARSRAEGVPRGELTVRAIEYLEGGRAFPNDEVPIVAPDELELVRRRHRH